jgi:hypothetical protein
MKLRLDILVDTAFHLAWDKWAVSIPEKSSVAILPNDAVREIEVRLWDQDDSHRASRC